MAEAELAYLIPALSHPDCCLVVPRQHVESIMDLPDGWWRDVKFLLSHAPNLKGDYNLSLNYGASAGQTVKHLHLWAVPRHPNRPSSGIGLAGFVHMTDESTTK